MPLSEWKECKLKDIADVTMGQSPKSENYNNIGDGKPFLQGNRTFGNKYPTFDTYTSQITRLAKPNDVIMSVRAPVGALNITPIEFCLGRGVCSIRMKNNNQEFLYHLLKYNVNSMINRESGTVFGSVNRTDIENLPVFVPCNDKEQQAIAEVLGSLDDKIELNRKMNKTLEDMAQAIFKSWFVDFDPVKAKAEGRTIEGLSQEILDLFPDSFEPSELGDIPKGWSIYEFDDILEITSSKRIFMSDYVSEGIPFYRSKEIIEKQKGNNVSTELFITKQKYNEIKDKFSVPKVGDILLTSVGTLGVSYLVKNSDEFYFKDGNLTWFKNYTKTFPEIIYYWLRSSMGQSRLEEISIGSTQKALTIASMKKINIILPSVEIQKELNMTFKIIRDNIDFHNNQIQTLSTMRDTLLPKLISGELRIPDAEKLMEGVV